MALILPNNVVQLINNLKFTSDEKTLLDTFKATITDASATSGNIHADLGKLKTDTYEASKEILASISQKYETLSGYGEMLTKYQKDLSTVNQKCLVFVSSSKAKMDSLKSQQQELQRNLDDVNNKIAEVKTSITEKERALEDNQERHARATRDLEIELAVVTIFTGGLAIAGIKALISQLVIECQQIQYDLNYFHQFLNDRNEEQNRLQSQLQTLQQDLGNAAADYENERQKPEVFRKLSEFGSSCGIALDHFRIPVHEVISCFEARNNKNLEGATEEMIKAENQAFLEKLKLRLVKANVTFPVFHWDVLVSTLYSTTPRYHMLQSKL